MNRIKKVAAAAAVTFVALLGGLSVASPASATTPVGGQFCSDKEHYAQTKDGKYQCQPEGLGEQTIWRWRLLCPVTSPSPSVTRLPSLPPVARAAADKPDFEKVPPEVERTIAPKCWPLIVRPKPSPSVSVPTSKSPAPSATTSKSASPTTTVTASVSKTATAVNVGNTLPLTGPKPGMIAAAAGGLVLAGAVLYFWVARKKRTRFEV